MKSRHWGLVASLGALVILPLVVVSLYLWTWAEDQYASTTGFTVRQEEGGSATDLLGGGLAALTGTAGSSDADILYEFIQSQEIVQTIEGKLGLIDHYAATWDSDPAFSLWPDADIEDLLWYWQRVVRISFDRTTGLIELQVLAFDPEMAQRIAREVVAQSETMINALNSTAREDTMRYARVDLEEAVDRLKAAREALTGFRTRTQIVDPSADIQGRMGVLNNLQQQLAEALIEFDILSETASASDPRLTQAARRIEVIQSRIGQERRTFTSDQVRGGDKDYPTLIAEYESLSVDREFAEESYRLALAAVDIARSNASRNSRYLATYINPTRPQTAQYPQRLILLGLAALFLTMAWSIMALIYYSLRDRR